MEDRFRLVAIETPNMAAGIWKDEVRWNFSIFTLDINNTNTSVSLQDL